MRLIDADALLKEYEGAFAYKLLKEVIGNMQTVEKETPKKPIEQATWKACPSCEQGIGVTGKTVNPGAIKYCWHCGQKLEWE